MRIRRPKLPTLMKLFVIFLVFCQAGHTEDKEIAITAEEVKSRILSSADLFICSDSIMLEFANIDMRECSGEVSRFSRACWHVIGKVLPNYEPDGDMFWNERIDAITNVYIYCVQTEMLMLAARTKKPQVTSEQ